MQSSLLDAATAALLPAAPLLQQQLHSSISSTTEQAWGAGPKQLGTTAAAPRGLWGGKAKMSSSVSSPNLRHMVRLRLPQARRKDSAAAASPLVPSGGGRSTGGDTGRSEAASGAHASRPPGPPTRSLASRASSMFSMHSGSMTRQTSYVYSAASGLSAGCSGALTASLTSGLNTEPCNGGQAEPSTRSTLTPVDEGPEQGSTAALGRLPEVRHTAPHRGQPPVAGRRHRAASAGPGGTLVVGQQGGLGGRAAADGSQQLRGASPRASLDESSGVLGRLEPVFLNDAANLLLNVRSLTQALLVLDQLLCQSPSFLLLLEELVRGVLEGRAAPVTHYIPAGARAGRASPGGVGTGGARDSCEMPPTAMGSQPWGKRRSSALAGGAGLGDFIQLQVHPIFLALSDYQSEPALFIHLRHVPLTGGGGGRCSMDMLLPQYSTLRVSMEMPPAPSIPPRVPNSTWQGSTGAGATEARGTHTHTRHPASRHCMVPLGPTP